MTPEMTPESKREVAVILLEMLAGMSEEDLRRIDMKAFLRHVLECLQEPS